MNRSQSDSSATLYIGWISEANAEDPEMTGRLGRIYILSTKQSASDSQRLRKDQVREEDRCSLGDLLCQTIIAISFHDVSLLVILTFALRPRLPYSNRRK